jgi:hypothetical protein
MRPRWRGGVVLYLDFDGVLHPEDVRRRPGDGPYVATPPGHVVFEHTGLLAECLAPYPRYASCCPPAGCACSAACARLPATC